MPPFPKPKFEFNYDPDVEIRALRKYRDTVPGRAIPAKASNRLLIGSWNLANFGVQERTANDHRVMAEVLSWFDVIAVQEVNDNLKGLSALRDHLPNPFNVVFSDSAGNNERMTYIYDGRKVQLRDEIGEIAIPPRDLPKINLPGIHGAFDGFDRNPYLTAFQAGQFQFELVNVHLFFGSDADPADMARRCLEAYAIARWADLRRKDANTYCQDVLVLGDFNLPKVDPKDPVYKALTKRGLQIPPHSTQIGTAIASESHYDQLAFFPDETPEYTGESGVFDWDGAIFKTLWNQRKKSEFLAYCKYHVSDHRPIWAQFKIA